jgi:hypothetical protein
LRREEDYCLSLDSSYKSSSLTTDVGAFHAYEHWQSEAVGVTLETGGGQFTKVGFLHALKSIREKTFKTQTIIHGFRVKPSIVLQNLEGLPVI